jgi:hypothetical protein
MARFTLRLQILVTLTLLVKMRKFFSLPNAQPQGVMNANPIDRQANSFFRKKELLVIFRLGKFALCIFERLLKKALQKHGQICCDCGVCRVGSML